ncbi:hypothetical protein ACH5RR_039276 [Cinchona calisaya]|uniref:Uncharacterized protein n=1 Tax=Cinchona calisaya TaxID=153742 RepID=A0ABD2XZ61_9GENT
MFHQSSIELHVVHSRFYNLTLARSVDYQRYLLLIHFATEFLRRPKGGLKPPFAMNPGLGKKDLFSAKNSTGKPQLGTTTLKSLLSSKGDMDADFALPAKLFSPLVKSDSKSQIEELGKVRKTRKKKSLSEELEQDQTSLGMKLDKQRLLPSKLEASDSFTPLGLV